MADAIDDASGQVDDSRRRLLEAVAQRGTAGRTEYEQSKAALASERENAVRQVMLDAARRGAPAEVQRLEADRVGSAYDRRLSDLGQGQSDLEQRLANMQTSGTQYFDEAKAAVPAIRAQAEAARDAAAQAAALRESSARSKASGADQGTLAALSKQLGGIANTNKYLLNQAGQYVKQTTAKVPAGKGIAGFFSSALHNAGVVQPQAASNAYDSFDKALNLPPGYSQSLAAGASAKSKTATGGTDPYAKKAGISMTQASKIRNASYYKSMVADATALLSAKGVSQKQARAALTQDYGSKYPQTLRLVLAELGL